MPKPRFDVLAFGCTAIDDLIFVESYPRADTKVRALARERQCGGLSATALVAASRLGACCAFAGVLGTDHASRFVLSRLEAEGIDTNHARRVDGAGPLRATVLVDQTTGSRTLLFDDSAIRGAEPGQLSDELLSSARVLFVDQIGVAGGLHAVVRARQLGLSVVADFERGEGEDFRALVAGVGHLIVSRVFGGEFTGENSPDGATRALAHDAREVAIVTCGEDGLWVAGRETGASAPRHVPSFPVEAVDTLGCGDVFHGAYAAALAEGMSLDARLRFASAAAAIKATRRGGQSGAPTRAEVDAFLEALA